MQPTQQNKLRTTVKHWEPCNNNNNTVLKTEQQTLNYLRHSLLSYILSFARLVEHSFKVTRARNPCLPTHQKEKCSTPPLSVYQTRQSVCVSQTVRLDSHTVSGGLYHLPDWLHPHPDCARCLHYPGSWLQGYRHTVKQNTKNI